MSWATPVLVSAGDHDEFVTSGNQAIIAYDPGRGTELWRMRGLESNAVTTPLVGEGVVVVSSGFPNKISMAVRPGGRGDVTDAVLWRYDKGSAWLPSPILYDAFVYLMTDRGLLTCLDAKTGAVRYEGQRPLVPATIMASPVAVDGRLLLMSQDGETLVVKAGPRFEIERVNTLASPSTPRPRSRGGASTSAARSTSSPSGRQAGRSLSARRGQMPLRRRPSALTRDTSVVGLRPSLSAAPPGP